jgi:hypothetical protein
MKNNKYHTNDKRTYASKSSTQRANGYCQVPSCYLCKKIIQQNKCKIIKTDPPKWICTECDQTNEKVNSLLNETAKSNNMSNEEKENKIMDLGLDNFFNFMHCKMDSDPNFNKCMKEYLQRDPKFLALVKNKDQTNDQNILSLIEKFADGTQY